MCDSQKCSSRKLHHFLNENRSHSLSSKLLSSHHIGMTIIAVRPIYLIFLIDIWNPFRNLLSSFTTADKDHAEAWQDFVDIQQQLSNWCEIQQTQFWTPIRMDIHGFYSLKIYSTLKTTKARGEAANKSQTWWDRTGSHFYSRFRVRKKAFLKAAGRDRSILQHGYMEM